MFAGGDRFFGVGLRGAGEDGDAARRLVGDDFDDSFSFFERETRELARRAIRVQTVDAALDQPIYVAT